MLLSITRGWARRRSQVGNFGDAEVNAAKSFVGRPNIGDKDRPLQRIGEVLDRHWLTNQGPCVEEFEHQMRLLLSVGHCDSLRNATDGLQLAMRAVGMRDEVIVPWNGPNRRSGHQCQNERASAAMGLTNLESLPDFLAANLRNYNAYRQGLDGLPGVRMLQYDATEKRNYQYIVLEIDERQALLTRDQLCDILWAENVLARRYFYPGCHRMQPYASYMPRVADRLPVTEQLARCVLVLPTGTAVTAQQVEITCEILRLAVSHGGDTAQELAGARAIPQSAGRI